jgi:cyanophycin synthetase
VVKEDDDGRGRAWGDVAELVVQGIQTADQTASYSILLNESEAIEWALDNNTKNTLVVIFPDNVSRAIALITARNPVPVDLMSESKESLQDNIPLLEKALDNTLEATTTSNNGSQSSYQLKT